MYKCSICGRDCNYKNDYTYILNDGRKVCKKHKESERLLASGESYEEYIKRRQLAKEESVKAKYGVSNVFQLKEVKDKIIEHYQENFDGATNPSQVKNFQDKKTSTSLERYGTPHPMQAQVNKDKVISTCQAMYGTSNVMQVQEFKDNYKSSSQANWGVDNPNQCKEVRNKISMTNLERYGTSMPLISDEVRSKAKATMESRYGVRHNWEDGELRDQILSDRESRLGVKYYSQSQLFKDKMHEYAKIERNNPQHIQSRINAAMAYGLEYVGQRVRTEDNETVITYRCPHCKVSFEWCQADDSRNPYCHNHECPSKSRSKPEIEVYEYIKGLIPEVEVLANDRTLLNGKEVDIYIPSHNLAIEFDGIYYHNGVNNSYKFDLCRSKSVRLIRVNEFEWNNQRSLIKSILKSALGLYDIKVYARNCIVKEISTEDYKNFLESSHLQGYIPASIKLGLFYEGKLIQVESYGKSRFDTSYSYELLRECSLPGYKILGGKSKIFRYFIGKYNPTSILSYCEKDKFSGKSYESIGFKLIRETSSGYKYYKDNQEFSRITFQKYKMPSLLGTLLSSYDENLSEIENMDINGYSRLYDYGNYVYVWSKTE